MIDQEQVPDPGRRQLLAAALLPGLERMLQPLSKKPDSYTEWFDAIHLDDANRCRQLLERGFDPNTIEPERFDTGLILSVRKKSWKVFAALLSARGIDLNARSRNGDTALMIAAFNGDVAAANRLIDKGAEINRPGWTALHYAAASGSLPIIRAGHEKVVVLLLEEGADVLLKNELGLDAIDFAKSQERTAIARILERWQTKASVAPKKAEASEPSLKSAPEEREGDVSQEPGMPTPPEESSTERQP